MTVTFGGYLKTKPFKVDKLEASVNFYEHAPIGLGMRQGNGIEVDLVSRVKRASGGSIDIPPSFLEKISKQMDAVADKEFYDIIIKNREPMCTVIRKVWDDRLLAGILFSKGMPVTYFGVLASGTPGSDYSRAFRTATYLAKRFDGVIFDDQECLVSHYIQEHSKAVELVRKINSKRENSACLSEEGLVEQRTNGPLIFD